MSNPIQLTGPGALFRDRVPTANSRFKLVLTEARKHIDLGSDGVANESEAAFRARTPTAKSAAAVARDLSMRSSEDDAALHSIQARTAALLAQQHRA